MLLPRIIAVAAFALLGIKYLRPWGVPLFAVIVLFILIGALQSRYFNVSTKHVRMIFILFWCYLLLQLFDLLRSVNLNQSIVDLLKYTALVVAMYVFSRHYRFQNLATDARLFAILSSLLLLFFFLNSMLKLQSPFLSADLYIRTEQGKNGLAMFGAISCIVSFWLLYSSVLKSRWILLPCLFISLSALIYTQSRGALIVLILSGLITYFSLLMKRSQRRVSRLVKTSLAFSIFIAYIAYVFSSMNIIDERAYFEQLTSLGTGRLTGSDEARKTLMQTGWRLFIDNPVFGIGTNNFQYRYELLTHNQYLQFAAENGFFMAAAVIVVFFLIIRSFFVHQKHNEFNPLYQAAFNIALFIFLYFIFINAYDTILTAFCLVICVRVLDNNIPVAKNMHLST